MSEVHAKLEQMRTAAGVLRDSGSRIETSVSTVHQTVDDLVALGFESPAATAFILRYRQQRTIMDEWPQLVKVFADRLDEAAEELAQALGLTQSPNTEPDAAPLPPAIMAAPVIISSLATRHLAENPSPRGRVRSWRRPTISRRRGAAAFVPETHQRVTPTQVSPTVEEPRSPTYLAKKNKPLYQLFVQKEAALVDAKADYAQMVQDRQIQLEELAALKNRALSADRATEITALPRYQAIEDKIDQLSQDMQSQTVKIRGIESELADLSLRLDKITPAPGADPALIKAMEGAQTAAVIKANTHDCVNYVVNRMAIPPKLPTDAHLWNDNIAKMPEYGIRIGHEPLEGSVMVMEREHPYADDLYGHLMYVERVEGDRVWVTDNYHPEPVLLSDVTDVTSGPTITYLYFPWETKA